MNNLDKVYNCILRILSPRCKHCQDSNEQCSTCSNLPSANLQLVNLVTGHITKRSINNVKLVKLENI